MTASSFDRVIITGSLMDACHPAALERQLHAANIRCFDLGQFAEPLRDALRDHAVTLARAAGVDVEFILKTCLLRLTAAHYDAVYGGMPEPTAENEERIKAFSTVMKLEPFQRGMKELAPVVWITALRIVQNPNRADLDIVVSDTNFGALKVSPMFYWSDETMDGYLKQYGLPNEWDYFDPAKADDKRECGLHTAWGGMAVKAWDHSTQSLPHDGV